MDALDSDRILKESLRSFVQQVLKHFHCPSMERLDAGTSEVDSRGDRIEHQRRHKGTQSHGNPSVLGGYAVTFVPS